MLTAQVLYQLGAVAALARSVGGAMTHVKPHGALYNRIVRDDEQAQAVVAAVARFDPTLTLVASQVALSFGIPFALVPLVRLAHDEAVMGERRTGRAQHVLLWVVVGLVVGLNLALLGLLVIG